MGTMTVSVEDSVEQRFRERAMQKFGKRKGFLGEAVTQAMEQWIEKQGQDAVSKTIEYLEKGLKLGGVTYKSRAELYDR